MPCLHDAETLGPCIEKAKRSFAELGIKGEIVVADNGSLDFRQLTSRVPKVFAISEGLLPEDIRLRRVLDVVTLETGLVFGAVLLLVCVTGSVYALSDWGITLFGP